MVLQVTCFALFKTSNGVYTQHIIDGECSVPSKVLEHTQFILGVYGVNDDSRITTNSMRIYLNESDFTTEIDTVIDDSVEDVFYEIFQVLDSKIDAVDVSTVGRTGSYNDLVDVPMEFTPTSHTHTSEEVSGVDGVAEVEIKKAYNLLSNKIRTYGV